MAEFRRANAEVDQAEGSIAIVGIEFGQQPGCVCVQGEQLDDWQWVALLTARGGSAVVQQLGSVIVGDEWFHGRCAQVVTINGALVLRKRVDVPKRDCASALLRQIAKADSTESVDVRIDECVDTEPMISVKAVFSIDTPVTSSSRKDYQMNTIDCSPMGRYRVSSSFYMKRFDDIEELIPCGAQDSQKSPWS